jgi:hypothetical protein
MMNYFVRVITEKQSKGTKLNESVFPKQDIYETESGQTVFEMPLPRSLTEAESDQFANDLAQALFEDGYDNFDIEIEADAE